MKKIYLVLLLACCIITAKAATVIVSVTSNQFTPAAIPNIVVGDVIQFNFVSGFHNALSTVVGAASGSVPAGAADINSGAPSGTNPRSYSYTVTVAGNYRYYCQVHSSTGSNNMFGTFTADAPVPVTLKSFDVAYSNKYAQATWVTSTEQNVDYFLLKKSGDGKNYTEAGRVKAVGNSNTEQSYTYQDISLEKNGRYTYYILATIDKDGKQSLSQVRLVRNPTAAAKLITQLNPNPVSKSVGHLMFQFNSDTDTPLDAVVIDASGKTVLKDKMSAHVGINNGHVHMGDFKTGMYTVIFRLNGIKEVYKVAVIK